MMNKLAGFHCNKLYKTNNNSLFKFQKFPQQKLNNISKFNYNLPKHKFYSTDAKEITFEFIDKEGGSQTVKAKVGESLLEIAHANKVDLEGACEGSLACSTCHVILTPDIYNSIAEPTDSENDMLDLAFGLTETSRLGCQVLVTENMEGMKVKLPSATRNMAVDGFKPKPH